MHLGAPETTELFAAIKLVFLLLNRALLEVCDLLREAVTVLCWTGPTHLKCRVQFLLLVWWTPSLVVQILRKLIFQETEERMGERSVSRRFPGPRGCLKTLLPSCTTVLFLSYNALPATRASLLKGRGCVALCKVCVSVHRGGLHLCRVRWQEFWGLLWHLCWLREVPRAPEYEQWQVLSRQRICCCLHSSLPIVLN